MEPEKQISEKTFKVWVKEKAQFTAGDGKQVEYFRIAEAADEEGNNTTYSVYSQTLAEEIKSGEEYKFQIETKEKNGFVNRKIINVAKPGEEFPVRESKSRYTKNYDAMNRTAAAQAAATLIVGGQADLASFDMIADMVLLYITKGSSNADANAKSNQ